MLTTDHRSSGRCRLRSRLARLAAVSLLCTAGGLAAGQGVTSAQAEEPVPVDCAGTTIFIAQGFPTKLYRVAISSTASGLEGSFAQVGTGSANPGYNAIGYRDADSFIYGINGHRHLVRIGGDGEAEDLGLVADLPGGSISGAFLPDGRLAVHVSTSLWFIDVDTLAATQQVMTFPHPGTTDLTYADGFLWADVGQDRMFRVDPATGATAVFPTPVEMAGVNAGAAWTFGNGNLGFADNESGTVFQVRVTDPASASPTFTVVSSMPGSPSAQNDGAACVGGPADLGLVKTAAVSGRPAGSGARPGDQITWTLSVSSNGPSGSSGYTLTDTLPAGISGASTTTPGCSINGSDLVCVLGELPSGQSRDVVMTATVTGSVGDLLSNTASVEGNEEDPVSANDSSTVETPIADVSGTLDDTEVGENGQPVTVDPLANDTPPSGGGTFDPTSVRLVDGVGDPVTELHVSGEGTYTVDTETGEVTFVPEPEFTGTTTPVPYRVIDSLGETVTANITIQIAPVVGVSWVGPGSIAALAAAGVATILARRRRSVQIV